MKSLEQTMLEMVNHLLNQHPELAPSIELLAANVSKKINAASNAATEIANPEIKIKSNSAPEITIPSKQNFIENLIVQRTDAFLKCGGLQALNVWFTTGNKSQLFDFLISNNLLQAYLKETIDDIAAEADLLIANTPNECFNHVVSIGPGNGLLELLLFKKTQSQRILLIDIEESDTHRHGFNQEGSGYASLNDTRDFLVLNGVPKESISICNPKLNPLPKFEFDLLISILSMGFHYPCDDYVDFICNNLREGGRVVFDKRKNVPDNGYETISRMLQIDQQRVSEKSDRVIFLR